MDLIPLIMQQVNFAALHEQVTRRLDNAGMDPKSPFAAFAMFGNPYDLMPKAYPFGYAKHIFMGFRAYTSFGEGEGLEDFMSGSGLAITPPDNNSIVITGTLFDFLYATLRTCSEKCPGTAIGNRFYIEFNRVKDGYRLFTEFSKVEYDGYFLLKRRCS